MDNFCLRCNMSEEEQLKCLANDVDALINRYREEFNISYATVVAVLTFKTHMMCQEAARQKED